MQEDTLKSITERLIKEIESAKTGAEAAQWAKCHKDIMIAQSISEDLKIKQQSR